MPMGMQRAPASIPRLSRAYLSALALTVLAKFSCNLTPFRPHLRSLNFDNYCLEIFELYNPQLVIRTCAIIIPGTNPRRAITWHSWRDGAQDGGCRV